MKHEVPQWPDAIESSQKNFSQTQSAQESTERMYNFIMGNLSSKGQQVPSFSQSQEIVKGLKKNDLKRKTPKIELLRGKKKDSSKKQPLLLTRILPTIAAAAIFVLVITNLNSGPKTAIMQQNYFDPPLTNDDAPVAILNSDIDFRSLASNNNFYIVYEEDNDPEDKVNLLLHSRAGKVNWKKVFITDANNNQITPLYVDEKNHTITIPLASSDLTLEVADEAGNKITCIVPRNVKA